MALSNIKHHFLDVSKLHTIHVIEAGNKQGPCVIFMHGGPGSGVNEKLINYIDCDYYHVFLIDQRGAGRSTPTGELTDNDLTSLVSDIETVRRYFDINSWLVTAGSWGCLLALKYAVQYPNRVTGLILRGCFLGRGWELDWLYTPSGAALYYPDVWNEFVEGCTATERTGILRHYLQKLTDPDENIRWQAAQRWLAWGSISMGDGRQFLSVHRQDRNGLIAKAKIMCHFLLHDCFMSDDNELLNALTLRKNMPLWIVQGRQDVICTPKTAWQLSRVHDNTQLMFLDGVGHSPVDPETSAALRHCFEQFKVSGSLA